MVLKSMGKGQGKQGKGTDDGERPESAENPPELQILN